jgi:ribosomal protein L34E
MKTSMKRTPEARVVSQLSRRKTSFAVERICGVLNGPFLIIRLRRVNPITVT